MQPTPVEPTRFEQGRPMLFAGLRRHHAFADSPQGIAAQWREFRQLGPIPHQVGGPAYGAICGGDPETQVMEYMCAVEVSEFDPAATHLGRMRVPPQHYAVFEHRGDPSTLHRTWYAIWHEWMPRSGYEAVNGPEFEVYGEEFDPETGRGIEVWTPVQPAGGS